MKFAIFSTFVSLALLANGAVVPKKEDVTTQEINKVMSDLIKKYVDQLEAKQPIPAQLPSISIKTENIDVQVSVEDAKQVIGRLSSELQSSSLTDSDVSAGFLLTLAGVVNVGTAQIKGTINKKPVDLSGQITMLAKDLLVILEVKAKHDPKSVTIVDLALPLTTNFEPTVTLYDVQLEEIHVIERAIEDELKKQMKDAQDVIEKGKPATIAYLNKLIKGKNLRDVIDDLSSNVPTIQMQTLLGF